MSLDEELSRNLSIPETAQRLGVSVTVVHRLIQRDALVPAEVKQYGKQTRRFFRARDVEALKKQRREEGL